MKKKAPKRTREEKDRSEAIAEEARRRVAERFETARTRSAPQRRESS